MYNLERALERLEEALKQEANPLAIDGTIQRFEFVIELFWKTLKRLLALEGIQTFTPKETLGAAYTAHWLEDENIWLQMLSDRNKTSHIYDEEMACRIYNKLQTYYDELDLTYKFLKNRFQNELHGR
jgi:nucleotidyltransferase substrate binding protein (TIGR01987 family)